MSRSLVRLQTFPEDPGVYIFWLKRTPLYIGKAANLKLRLASYFTRKTEGLMPKVKRMLEEATRVETIGTESEIEALIKEAELIKRFRPKYNVLMRDDKSYSYVAITREEFPRIFTTHQPRSRRLEISTAETGPLKRPPKLVSSRYPLVSRYIGPFTGSTELRTTLKLLRRVFPYCTCKGTHRRPCLNSEIGRCLGYCCLDEKRRKTKDKGLVTEYRKNIRKIVAVLTGKRTRLLSELKQRIKEAARQERYEEAARLRDQVQGLEGVFSHRSVIQRRPEGYSWRETLPKLQTILGSDTAINRIEGYDISNISGTEATGSMAVFIQGRPEKSEYRKFKIKTVRGISDVAMLKEVLRRRFRHPEWPYPELIVVDGGKPQLNAATRELQATSYRLPAPLVTALAKREEILYAAGGRAIALKKQDPAILHLFQRIRDESHRFARAYHHKLRERSYAQARS